MALRGNGQLLVKVRGRPFPARLGAEPPFVLPGYALEPLSTAPRARSALGAAAPADHWLLARPEAARTDASPWQRAHAAAEASGYAHYVEPDILHEGVMPPPGKLDGGLDEDWPPAAKDDPSPGWHLDAGFTGFAGVRAIADGAGVRIAQLDTGYTPGHASTPRRIRPQLGHDYWDDKPDAIDPGTSYPGLQPGHGTATLALLAGGTLDLSLGTHRFQGDFGGAPEAEVIPVRIGPSVIHLYTSTMAKGLYHALAPGGDPANRCDVVTISHGGLPSASWADAVNALYAAGVVIVAASGDSIHLEGVDLATRYTVYPSAFNRVVTALGVTHAKQPYVATTFGAMQGCWGPGAVMEKALAAYTPNVAWMRSDDLPAGFEMSGRGTSASTPQIAAACALWLQLYGGKLPADWRRVEACRLALFDSAAHSHPDKPRLGWGLLDVARMLDCQLAAGLIAKAEAGQLDQSPDDQVSFPFWRLLVGLGPPGSEKERMYEAEVAQVVLQSVDPELRKAAREAAAGATFSPAEQARYRTLLAAETISDPLRQRLSA